MIGGPNPKHYMYRTVKKLTCFFIVLLLAAACKPAPDEKPSKRTVISGIDTSKKPGDDFFSYVNSIWWDTVKIPGTQSGVGSYSFLNYPQRIRMQAILDSISLGTHPAGSIEQKVGDFYAAGMDTAAINKRGYEPIKPVLTSIDAVTDIPSLLKLV